MGWGIIFQNSRVLKMSCFQCLDIPRHSNRLGSKIHIIFAFFQIIFIVFHIYFIFFHILGPKSNSSLLNTKDVTILSFDWLSARPDSTSLGTFSTIAMIRLMMTLNMQDHLGHTVKFMAIQWNHHKAATIGPPKGIEVRDFTWKYRFYWFSSFGAMFNWK